MIQNHHRSRRVWGAGMVLAGAIVGPTLAQAASPPLINQPPPATPPSQGDRLPTPQPPFETPSPVGRPEAIAQNSANEIDVAIVPPRTLPPPITVPPPNRRPKSVASQQSKPAADVTSQSQAAVAEPTQRSSDSTKRPSGIAQPETQSQTPISSGEDAMAIAVRQPSPTQMDLLPVPDVPLPAISRDKPPARRVSARSGNQPIVTQPNREQPATPQRVAPQTSPQQQQPAAQTAPAGTNPDPASQTQSSASTPKVNPSPSGSSAPAQPQLQPAASQPVQMPAREVTIAPQPGSNSNTEQPLVEFLPSNSQDRADSRPASQTNTQTDNAGSKPILRQITVSRSPEPRSQAPSEAGQTLTNTTPLPQAPQQVRSANPPTSATPRTVASPAPTRTAQRPPVVSQPISNGTPTANQTSGEMLTVPIEVAPDYPLPASQTP